MADKTYEDFDGNQRSLYQMVRREPDWAEARIRQGEIKNTLIIELLESIPPSIEIPTDLANRIIAECKK